LNTERKLKIHEDINVDELMSEFEKLFQNKHSSDHVFNLNRIHKKSHDGEKEEADEYNRFNHSEMKTLPNLLTTNKSKIAANDGYSNNEGPATTTLHITNYLLHKIENQEIQKLTNKNYKKFKSIPLAVEETKKLISKDYYLSGDKGKSNSTSSSSNNFSSKFKTTNESNIHSKINTKTSENISRVYNSTGFQKFSKTGTGNHFSSVDKSFHSNSDNNFLLMNKNFNMNRGLHKIKENSLDNCIQNENSSKINLNLPNLKSKSGSVRSEGNNFNNKEDYIPLSFLKELMIKNKSNLYNSNNTSKIN
jgi:hypothetical protein